MKRVMVLMVGILMCIEFTQVNAETSEKKSSNHLEKIAQQLDKVKVKAKNLVENEIDNKKKDAMKAEEQAVKEQKKASPEAFENNKSSENTEVHKLSGREIGEKNREYGEKLSQPNLSDEERQQIIREKKEFNQNNRR